MVISNNETAGIASGIEVGWVCDDRGERALEVHDFQQEEIRRSGLTVGVCTYKRPSALGVFLASLDQQDRVPERLVIVDASPDADSESIARRHTGERYAIVYVRVGDRLRGLTRQRNLAIRLFETDLACFFDDDIELEPNTLRLLEAPLRERKDLIAAGCFLGSLWRDGNLPLRWRIRRSLGLWHWEEIGRLARAGMAVPYALWPPFSGLREVEIVQGGATCWRTSVLKAVPFEESFAGYGQAEDIEYSLKTRHVGQKVIVGEARPQHHHASGGRISEWEYGRQCSTNFVEVYSRFGEKSLRSLLRFLAWQSLDLLMILSVGIRNGGHLAQALGRCAGLYSYLFRRSQV